MPTTAMALDRSDVARSRMFHAFGIVGPFAVIAMSFAIVSEHVL
jgi:hypothetical protein